MTQTFSKLKIISKATSSRSKNQTSKTQSNNPVFLIRKQISTQTDDKKFLQPCSSTKTLYKSKYQQCQERLGQENEYLRGFMMDLNLKLNQKDNDIKYLQQNNQKLRNQRDQLQNEVKTMQESQKNKQKQYQEVLQQLRKQSSQRINQYTSNINSMKEMMNIRQKCISQLRSNINSNIQNISQLKTQNENLKTQLQELNRFKTKPGTSSVFQKEPKVQKRRAKSTLNGNHLKELVIQDVANQSSLSPKEAARMDVLLDEYTELKSRVMKGNIDSNTGFRLITLIQYLKQTLNKKNIQNLQLKQWQKQEFRDNEFYSIAQKYQKTIFGLRQEIQSLQCQIRILKDQKIQIRIDDIRPLTQRNKSFNYQSYATSRKNSNNSIQASSKKQARSSVGFIADFQKYMSREQENTWRVESPFAQTQNISYRQLAKKQLINKLDSNNSVLNQFRRGKQNNGLSERRNSGFNNTVNLQKYNQMYNTRCGLDQFLRKSMSLITYMNLVLRITEMIEKSVKSQIYQIFSIKDIIVVASEVLSSDSMKMKCELRKIQQDESYLIDNQYLSPQYSGVANELSMMWSLGVVFRKIFQSISTDNSQQQKLFTDVVKPQFQKIISSLIVQSHQERMSMNNFKEMLAKLS